MSEKHTPGPWALCSAKKCTCMMIFSKPADQHVATTKRIACVHGKWGDSPEMIYGEVPSEQVQANAHLIAAAPDLLAALETAHEAIRRIRRDGYLHHDLEMVADVALKECAAALAKVKA